MSYLHCCSCNWSQDDFWDEDNNPITWLERNYTKELLTEPLDEFEKHTPLMGKVYYERLTRREKIAQLLEGHAKDIRQMKYRTLEEFKMANNPKCPKCGNMNWELI